MLTCSLNWWIGTNAPLIVQSCHLSALIAIPCLSIRSKPKNCWWWSRRQLYFCKLWDRGLYWVYKPLLAGQKVFAAFYRTVHFLSSTCSERTVQYTKLVILPRLTCTRKGYPLEIINPWDQASSPLCCLAPTPSPRQEARLATHREGEKERQLADGEGRTEEGAKSYDVEKVWSSISFNTLCVIVTSCHQCRELNSCYGG